MTKQEFLTNWEDDLKFCEIDYRRGVENNRSWYEDYHNGGHRRGGPPRMPDHTIFRNRLSSRLNHVYKEQLEQLPEDERIDIEKAATTMMLEKMRELEVEISYGDDLGEYIKLDPKNIQYIDLLSWGINKECFFAKMVTENPEVLSFLTAEQVNAISKGNPDYIVQLVRGNAELANKHPLSEIIANDPALTKEITILQKEREVESLRTELEKTEQEIEQLKEPAVEKEGETIGK